MPTSSLAEPSRSAAPGLLAVRRWLMPLVGHALLVAVLYASLYAFGVLDAIPNGKRLIVWDAGWFDSVRQTGYVATASGQSNIPFFPLFPYLWRFSGLDSLGISILNAGMMLVGCAVLGATFQLSRRQLLLLAAVPSLFIGLVPYAEAMFFVFGAVFLRGLHRRHLLVTVLGLIGCCLTRSAATLFVPAFVLAEVLACTSRADVLRTLGRIVAGLLAIALALGAVMYLHYLATGNWFALFDSYKSWGHELRWALPARMHSSAGIPMLGLDLIALLTGIVATLACTWLSLRWLRGWWQPTAPVAPSRAVVFALGYCVGVLAFLLLYQEGDLANGSRYVLGTPFFGLLLAQLPRWQYLAQATRWAVVGGVGLLGVALAYWCGWPMRFPGFFPAEANFFFAVWLAYLALHLAAFSRGRYSREISTGLYVTNVLYQVILLNLFLSEIWMG